MKRFIFGTLASIIIFVAFAFLWISNPLYAFVGAIVFLVFMIVGFAFLMNLPSNSDGVGAPASMPQRTSGLRSDSRIAKPEDNWTDEEASIEDAVVDANRSKKLDNAPAPPPQAKPEKPLISPGASQNFGAVAPPAPLSPPEPEPEPAPPQEETRKMDTATFFGVKGEEEGEAKELPEPDTGAELIDEEARLDRFADNVKRKLEEGTFGESPDEVEDFFKEAFEKASTRDDLSDYIDDDDYDEDFLDEDGLEYIPRPVTEAENELDEEIIMDTDSGAGGAAPDNLPDQAELPETEEPDGVASPGTTTGSSHFDLMGMVGSLPPDKQQEFFALMTDVPIGEQTKTQLIRLYEGLMGKGSQTEEKQVSEAQFTAYYPRQVAAGTEYGFYVYAHLPDALINADIQQFEAQLGGRVPKPKIAQEVAKVEEGASLGVVIYCDKLNFNQSGAIQQWKAPFVRFDFQFKADEAQVDEIVSGRIAIVLGIIEVASIDFQLAVVPPNPLEMLVAVPHEPLTAKNFDATATAAIYQKIFISYSRKDTVIAEQYRKAQIMAGNIIFMDTHSIRAGQDWEVALKQFIDEADVFQLFWSEHSAISDHVKFEWEYALSQRCPETRCVQFIRPAYWQKPLAQIPPELGHLHFAYVEMEND